MNTFKVIVKEIERGEFQSIPFTNTLILEAEIDERSTINDNFLEDGFVVYLELKKSKQRGCFYIFCEINGVADEGGWEGVDVEHLESEVKWSVKRGGASKIYLFDRALYLDEIARIEKIVSAKPSFTPEPANIFPHE